MTGNLSDNWNVITYMLLVVPMILLTERKKKESIFIIIGFIHSINYKLKKDSYFGLVDGVYNIHSKDR